MSVRAMSYGKLCQLMGSASPFTRLVTPDKDTASLVAGGLMAEDARGFMVTPDGLRALAVQLEFGHVDRAIGKLKREQSAKHRKS